MKVFLINNSAPQNDHNYALPLSNNIAETLNDINNWVKSNFYNKHKPPAEMLFGLICQV
jgi:hypothetical protein